MTSHRKDSFSVEQPKRPELTQRGMLLDRLGSIAVIIAATAFVGVTLAQAIGEKARLHPDIPIGTPEVPVTITNAPSKGSPSAKVVVIEFSEFQCPFCGRFAREVFPVLEQAHIATGEILFVFRHFPLDSHADAFRAAEMSFCAATAKQFWPMHDRLFALPLDLKEPRLRRHAAEIGIDNALLDHCLNGDARSGIALDKKAGRNLGILGTPTFLVGVTKDGATVTVRQVIRGLVPAEKFSAIIREVLSSVEASLR